MPQYDFLKKYLKLAVSIIKDLIFFFYTYETFVNDVSINGQVGNSKAPFLHKNNNLAKSIRTNFCRSLESSQNLKN